MDPRPYHYQYRRPRYNNPTYQSYNAYQSLYHAGKLQSQYHNPMMLQEHAYRMNLYNPSYSHLYTSANPNQNVTVKQESQLKRYEDKSINTDRYSEKSNQTNSNHSQRSKSSASSKQNGIANASSLLSSYGSKSLQKNRQSLEEQIQMNRVMVRNDTSSIYKRQQKPFDIINLYSRESQPLRKFPKLTQEHLLYERGIIKMQ